jgi:glycosyltransferase involved in cell wall biosynthesis
VVHAHNWIVNSAVALRRSAAGNPPFALVLTLHDYSQVCATKRLMRSGERCPGPSPRACLSCAVEHYGPLRGAVTVTGTAAMRPWKARAVQHVVSVSRAVAHGNGVERLGVPSSVVPNFIPDDLGAAREAAAPSGVPDERPSGVPSDDPSDDQFPGKFLFFVGDLSPEKGVLTLLDAYRRLGPDRPPLVLAGRPHEGTPKRLPDGARILPGLPHDQVMAALRRCRCAVLPSIWPDPCPTTVLEAMAAGTPVITTSTGGMVDMVTDGVNGLLVPPGDVAALAGAIRRVLDDPALAARLAATGAVDVGAFRASPVAERLEAVYRSALQAVATR